MQCVYCFASAWAELHAGVFHVPDERRDDPVLSVYFLFKYMENGGASMNAQFWRWKKISRKTRCTLAVRQFPKFEVKPPRRCDIIDRGQSWDQAVQCMVWQMKIEQRLRERFQWGVLATTEQSDSR